MDKQFGIECEKAIRFLCKSIPPAEELTKPTLFHCIRTGVYLYENGYSRDIVLAGFLHDVIEDTGLSEEDLRSEFGEKVAKLVVANSKDKTITDSDERIESLVKQCIEYGEEALIVKAADVIDNFSYFSQIKDPKGVNYCQRNAEAIFKQIPNSFLDKIFNSLKEEYAINEK